MLELPETREAQNGWVKAQISAWQACWHDFFDLDSNLVAAGEFDRPAQLPLDKCADYRLIYGLVRALPETRAMCFSLFPDGDEMWRRFEQYLVSKPTIIVEENARSRLMKIFSILEKIDLNEDVDFSNIRVLDRDTDAGRPSLQHADNVTVLIESPLLALKKATQLPRTAAKRFLTEPLYASAGNNYHVRDWVCSAMTGPLEDSLMAELYRLWLGGWEVYLGDEGVILAHFRASSSRLLPDNPNKLTAIKNC